MLVPFSLHIFMTNHAAKHGVQMQHQGASCFQHSNLIRLPRNPREWGKCHVRLEWKVMPQKKRPAQRRTQADNEVRKNLPPGVKLVRTLRGHTRPIGRIAWSPDGQMLASPSHDGTIRLWDHETGQCLRVLEDHRVHGICVAFDPTGRTLASSGLDTTVQLWEPATGKLLRRLQVGSPAYSVA